MDLTAVALRAKALRGLSTIVSVDPDVLGLPQVRQAFEARLSDPSPAVREPAVDLVGKYMLQKPALAAEYYPHIALRVTVRTLKGGADGRTLDYQSERKLSSFSVISLAGLKRGI